MKKIIFIMATIAFCAAPAFAGTSVTMNLASSTGLSVYGDPSNASSGGTLIGKTSTGVGVGALVDSGGGGYAIVTQHKSGTKAFGTSYDSTSIFTTTAAYTPGSEALSVPTATDTTDFTSGWKAM